MAEADNSKLFRRFEFSLIDPLKPIRSIARMGASIQSDMWVRISSRAGVDHFWGSGATSTYFGQPKTYHGVRVQMSEEYDGQFWLSMFRMFPYHYSILQYKIWDEQVHGRDESDPVSDGGMQCTMVRISGNLPCKHVKSFVELCTEFIIATTCCHSDLFSEIYPEIVPFGVTTKRLQINKLTS